MELVSLLMCADKKARKGSVQELSERLHFVKPLVEDVGAYDPSNGYPNSVQNGMFYAQNHGLFKEWKYPTRAKVALLKDITVVDRPGKKIYIEDSKWIESDMCPEFHAQVRAQLLKHPVIATVACLEAIISLWDGKGLYEETPKERENVKRIVEVQRNQKKLKASDPKVMSHSVVIVGHGVSETGVEYYIVENSWGEDWGYFGYGMIAKDCIIEAGWPIGVHLQDPEVDFWANKRAKLV